MFGEFISHDTSCLVYILGSNGKAFQHGTSHFFLDSGVVIICKKLKPYKSFLRDQPERPEKKSAGLAVLAVLFS